MSIGIAQCKYIFGFRTDVKNCLAFIDEQTCVYPAANHLVLYNLHQHTQRTIPCTDVAQQLTCIAISSNHRNIAVAESLANKSTISIFDAHTLKRRKLISQENNGFISIKFSSDSKFIISLAENKTEQVLSYWIWEKAKEQASVVLTPPVHINEISFDPNDNTLICCTGNKTYRMYRYIDSNLKVEANYKQEESFSCHCWLSSDQLLAGTEDGKLIIYEKGELKWSDTIIPLATETDEMALNTLNYNATTMSQPSDMADGNTNINAIIVSSKEIIVSCGYERAIMYDKEKMEILRNIRIPSDNSVEMNTTPQIFTSFSINSSEETLVLSTNKSQLCSITFSKIDVSNSETIYCDYFNHSFHSNAVTGMDVCARKALVATCSNDRSIRIWDYEKCRLEIYKVFAEEALCISLHPSGLYILVGFSNKLRLMNILIDDIRHFKEFNIRSCKECQFSNGGAYFAAVHGNIIQVHSTISFETIAILKGHNGTIHQLLWNQADTILMSCDAKGAVYEWDVINGKRTKECVLKSCAYTGITFDDEKSLIYAVGKDRTLKEINGSAITKQLQVTTENIVLTTVVLSNSGRLLFCGTNRGTIRSYKFPLVEEAEDEYTEYIGHTSPVIRMRINVVDEYLLSCDMNGSIIIWKVTDKDNRGLKRDREVTWAEEILITKSDLEDKNSKIHELEQKIIDEKTDHEYQLGRKEMNHKEKMDSLSDQYMHELESLKTNIQVLKTDKEKENVHYNDVLADTNKKYQELLQEMQSTNEQKLRLEYEKHQELQNKNQHLQEDYERRLQTMEHKRESDLQQLHNLHQNEIDNLTTTKNQLQEEINTNLKEYEEMKKQIEEDADEEIRIIKTNYEHQLQNSEEVKSKLSSERETLKKKFTSLENELKLNDEKIQGMRGEATKLQNNINNLERDILGLKKEIQERDDTIQEKEKRIYELKKKNQELEKFKFVLDYKNKELKKKIEPREMEIITQKTQIDEMEGELEKFYKQNNQLDLNIVEFKQKLTGLEKELKRERERKKDLENTIKKIESDIYNVSEFVTEPKQLKLHFKNLIEKYCRYEKKEKVQATNDIEAENSRQRQHLEQTVQSLKVKSTKDVERQRQDQIRVMKENVILIEELNNLRAALTKANKKIFDLEAALGIKRNAAARTTEEFSEILNRYKNNHLVVEREKNFESVIEEQKNEIQKLRTILPKSASSMTSITNDGKGTASLPPI
ncbi:hypothetical protein SNEBB_006235 [Seison nebaliae]|nr:hypothetical protein SNEBB_006235 [Seison nebaliae]